MRRSRSKTKPALPPFPSSAALALALLAGCGADPPTVPPAEPASAECKVPDPPEATPDAPAPAGTGRFLPAPVGEKAMPQKALGPNGLRGLRPQDGPNPALPMSLPQMMSARHSPSAMQWRALPPGSDAALVEMIGDAGEDPKVRARAMEGLAVRAPEGGDAALRAVLADGQADGTARRAAARALSSGYVKGGADPAAQALIAALADPDPQMREAAVKALAPHAADPTVRAALEARAAVEDAPLVAEALAEALAG